MRFSTGRLALVVGLVSTALGVAPSPVSATGRIVGSLAYEDGTAVANGDLQFLSAINAEIVATTATDSAGVFSSVPLPKGGYKLRVPSHNDPDSNTCSPGGYLDTTTAFRSDVFDSGVILVVSDGQDTIVTAQVALGKGYYCGPMQCESVPTGFSASIVDAQTLEPLPGIKVRLKDPESAMLLLELTTDAEGTCNYKSGACSFTTTKVRLFDPTGRHVPEYYGASGSDAFSLGQVLDIRTGGGVVAGFTEQMAQRSPTQQIGTLIEQVVELPLPVNGANGLVAVLEQAQHLLEDSNPNNDKGACGLLRSFLSQLEGMAARGEVDVAEAEALSESAIGIRNALGCKP